MTRNFGLRRHEFDTRMRVPPPFFQGLISGLVISAALWALIFIMVRIFHA